MRNAAAHILFVMFSQFINAQNLIPDPGFEANKFTPVEFSSINASNSWSIPSRGTSDLFCKCDRKTKMLADKAYSYVDVPQNAMGYQRPNSGTCYAGLFAHSHGDYREYLQTPLTEPLQKGKTYLFTMYVSLADYSRATVDQLGVCFLKKKLDYVSSDVITDLSPVYMKIEEIGDDVENWHPVSANYKAEGGESCVLFGSFEVLQLRETSFKAPKEMRTRINQNTAQDAYYYIDDVCFEEINAGETIDPLEDVAADKVEEIAADTLVVLKNVLFQTNETILLPPSYSELSSLAGYLKKNEQIRIGIFGHTDNSGSEPANKKLSIGRAKAVADYLASQGVEKKRINYEGYGSLKPVADNDTEEGRQQNRRVEFILTEN